MIALLLPELNETFETSAYGRTFVVSGIHSIQEVFLCFDLSVKQSFGQQ